MSINQTIEMRHLREKIAYGEQIAALQAKTIAALESSLACEKLRNDALQSLAAQQQNRIVEMEAERNEGVP